MPGPPSRPANATTGRCASGATDGRASAWSTPAFWETGLMGAAQLEGEVDHARLAEDTTQLQPASPAAHGIRARRRRRFGARLRDGLGLYEMQINGQRVGDHVFAPGWTSYDKRLQYQTYDVTDLVKRGPNAMGVTLGDGWYRGQSRLRQAAQHLRQARRPAGADRRALHRRPRAGHRHRRQVEVVDGADSRVRHLQRRDATTRGSRRAGWSRCRLRRHRAGRAFDRIEHRRRSSSRRPVRRCAASRRSSRSRCCRRRLARRCSTWGRTWSAGCDCGARARRARP